MGLGPELLNNRNQTQTHAALFDTGSPRPTLNTYGWLTWKIHHCIKKSACFMSVLGWVHDIHGYAFLQGTFPLTPCSLERSWSRSCPLYSIELNRSQPCDRAPAYCQLIRNCAQILLWSKGLKLNLKIKCVGWSWIIYIFVITTEKESFHLKYQRNTIQHVSVLQ